MEAVAVEAVSLQGAFKAGIQAGNVSMHASGRKSWAQDDYAAAEAAFMQVLGCDEPLDGAAKAALLGTFRSLVK